MFTEIYSLFLDKWTKHSAAEEPPSSLKDGGAEKKHTNNWAVLVCSSRYWFNYRVCCAVLVVRLSLTPSLAYGQYIGNVRGTGQGSRIPLITIFIRFFPFFVSHLVPSTSCRSLVSQVSHRQTPRHSRLPNHPHARRRCRL